MSKELPIVFESVEQAVKLLKLDRRRKWYAFLGNVIYDHKYTAECTGCDGGGCFECGYHGKSRTACPVPAINPKTGNPVEVKTSKP